MVSDRIDSLLLSGESILEIQGGARILERGIAGPSDTSLFPLILASLVKLGLTGLENATKVLATAIFASIPIVSYFFSSEITKSRIISIAVSLLSAPILVFYSFFYSSNISILLGMSIALIALTIVARDMKTRTNLNYVLAIAFTVLTTMASITIGLALAGILLAWSFQVFRRDVYTFGRMLVFPIAAIGLSVFLVPFIREAASVSNSPIIFGSTIEFGSTIGLLSLVQDLSSQPILTGLLAIGAVLGVITTYFRYRNELYKILTLLIIPIVISSFGLSQAYYLSLPALLILAARPITLSRNFLLTDVGDKGRVTRIIQPAHLRAFYRRLPKVTSL